MKLSDAKEGRKVGVVLLVHAFAEFTGAGYQCRSKPSVHPSTRAEQSMELENLELDYLKLFEKLHPALLVFVLCNLNRAK